MQNRNADPNASCSSCNLNIALLFHHRLTDVWSDFRFSKIYTNIGNMQTAMVFWYYSRSLNTKWMGTCASFSRSRDNANSSFHLGSSQFDCGAIIAPIPLASRSLQHVAHGNKVTSIFMDVTTLASCPEVPPNVIVLFWFLATDY